MSYALRTDRNRGFIRGEAQQQLRGLTVAVAGAGGDGGHVAVSLARLGVTSFRLADPEQFEIENCNRQTGCNDETIGENKAEVIAGLIRAINPELQVTVFCEGVTAENLDAFMNGVDLVVDESDYTLPHVGLMIARRARSMNVPVVTVLNIGFGALFTAFVPEGTRLEKFLGVPEGVGSDDETIPLWRWVPRLPSYADVQALGPVERGEQSAPSVAPGVQLAAALICSEIVRWVETGRFAVVAPRMIAIDLRELTVRKIRFRKVHWYRSLISLLVASKRSQRT